MPNALKAVDDRPAQEDRLWAQLVRFIAEGSVVPIVGPELLEISTDDGSTKNFYTLVAEELAKVLDVDPPQNAGWRALNEVACEFLANSQNRTEELYPEVMDVVQRLERSVPLPDALAKLAGMPFRLFVTTTFDSLLARAIDTHRQPGITGSVRQVEYSPGRITDLEAVRENDVMPVVFHLFGKASASPEYAVTDEDVLEFMHALQSEARRPRELFRRLQSKNLLIIGCGFPDWLTRFFIRLGKQERLVAAYGKTDMVADSAAANPDFIAFLDRFSRSTRRFSVPPLEFVNCLSKALPPQLTLPSSTTHTTRDPDRDILPGAVFLSYASEDRHIVEQILASLDKNGVDCWFDRRQLEGGDDWRDKIGRNVYACSLFFAIVSRSTLTDRDRFFRIEWRQALERQLMFPDGARFIVPIVVDETGPDAPNMLKGFEHLQWHPLKGGEVTPDFISHVKRWYRQAQAQHAR
jgi:hypothetical protein